MRLVILTGAGISQESGLSTFRGAGSQWRGRGIEALANGETFRDDPKLVFDFYNERRRALLDPRVQPNAAHEALARLERHWPAADFTLVTQNVDDLHERAGSRRVLHIHGELLKARCLDTGNVFDWRDDLDVTTPHPDDPARRGRLRPHIVWFGEMPLALDVVFRELSRCDCFVAIGTSGVVWPAAGFVQAVSAHCRKIEINLEDTPVAGNFDECRRGAAAVEVPRWVDTLLRAASSLPEPSLETGARP